MQAHDETRTRFEAAVIERLKESGFLEIEIRTECLARVDDGYQDEVINAGWYYWQAAIGAKRGEPRVYVIGDKTMDHVLKPSGLTNLSDMQAALDAVEVALAAAPPTTTVNLVGLTLASLQRSHVERQEEWCPDQKPDLSFRGNELGGECGEAQNVIKKLERERHGWRGSRDTVQHLAEELADVIHCAILVAITAGIEIEPAVVAKFNDTSQKNGLRTLLTTEGQNDGDDQA